MLEAAGTIAPAREPSEVAPSLSLAMIAVGIALVAIDLRPRFFAERASAITLLIVATATSGFHIERSD